MSASKSSLFDNEAWVKNNMKKLYPDDPNQTFKVVRKLHPHYGCAWDVQKNPSAGQKDIGFCSNNLDELAKYADAVTVCCFEAIGNSLKSTDDLLGANKTAIGGYAYIAKHHSKKEVREFVAKQICECKKHLEGEEKKYDNSPW